MTDFQFKAIVKMILEIVKESKDIASVIIKLEKLLEDNTDKAD